MLHNFSYLEIFIIPAGIINLAEIEKKIRIKSDNRKDYLDHLDDIYVDKSDNGF